MSYKFNPFTGKLDIVTSPPLKKIEYNNQLITVNDNNFLILLDPILLGSTNIVLEGDSVLRIF